MNKIKISRRPALILSTVALLIALVPIGLSTWFFFKYSDVIMSLSGSPIRIKRTFDISIDTLIPVNAALDTTVTLPFNKDIKYSIPFNAKLTVPINTTFKVPITQPVRVKVDHDFKIDQVFQIKSTIPVDTMIETKIMGVTTELPVKADIPVNMPVRLKDYIKIDEDMTFRAPDPIVCAVNQELTVPVNYVIEGVLPVRDQISIPLKFDLPTQVTIREKVPCIVEFDLYFDFKKGFRLKQPHE